MADLRRKVVLTGDSSSADAAIKSTTGLLDQFGRKLNTTSSAQQNLANKTKGLDASLEKIRRTVDRNYASTKAHERAVRILDRSLASAKITQAEYNRLVDASAHHYNVAEQAAHGMNRALRASRFHTANLAAQFFDVGVMMTSGQNPFIMGVQQGSQFSQVLQVMGGRSATTMSLVKSLGRAFMQLLHPITLVSVGLVAGAGYLFQWATRADETEEKVDALSESMLELEKSTAQAEAAIRLMFSGFDTAEQLLMNDQLLSLRREEAKLLQEINSIMQAGARGQESRLLTIRATLAELQKEISAAETILETNRKTLRNQEALEQGLKSLATLQENVVASAEKMPETYRETLASAQQLTRQLELQAGVAMEKLTWLVRQYRGDMTLSADEASRLAGGLARSASNMTTIGSIDIATPISMAAGAASSLARFLGIAVSLKSQLSMGAAARIADEDTVMSQDAVSGNAADRYGKEDLLRMGYTPDYLKTQGFSFGGGAGGGGGGGGSEDPIVAELERLQESLMTQLEMEKANFEERQLILEEALEKKLLTQEEYNELMRRAQEEHAQRMVDLESWQHMTGLQRTEKFMGDMADALARGNEEMVRISKVFGAAEALINAWRTFSQVMADETLPWFMKLPTAISLLGAAMQAVSAIQGIGKGGSGQRTASATAGPSDAGSAGAPPEQPQMSRTLTLIGDRFNRAQAEEIARFMNDGTDDGLIIRGRA